MRRHRQFAEQREFGRNQDRAEILSDERSARDLGITVDELKQKIADGELLQRGKESILWHVDSRYDEKPLPVHPSEAEKDPTSRF